MRERRWLTLIAVSAATFMLLVDITIVQVALPQVQRDLHATITDLQWVIDAYALALAALILTGGSLADLLGRKRVFGFGVVVFTGASAVCGLSGSIGVLIVARVIQGVGGAAMFATSLALIGQEFAGSREFGTAIAAWSATVGGGVAIGPLLGGLLTQGLGWQWIFYVNIPVGLGALALVRQAMVNMRDPDAGRIDLGGLITLSGMLFLAVFAVLRGNAEGWGSATIVGAFALSAAALVLFLGAERRADRPMLDLSLFSNITFGGVSLATFAIGVGMFAMFLYIALYLQDLLGYSPLAAGLRTLPMTVPVFVVPLAVRRLGGRLPPGAMLGVGLVLVSSGLLLMHLAVADNSGWTALLPGMIVAGVGIGVSNPVIAQTALAVVALQRSGMASGISNTCRVGGVAVGIAALGALFVSRLGAALRVALPTASPRLGELVSAGGLRAAAAVTPPAQRHAVLVAARHAFVVSFNELSLVGSVTVLIGATCAATMIRRRDFRAATAPVPTAVDRVPTPVGPVPTPVEPVPTHVEPVPTPVDPLDPPAGLITS
jgi:EmrB/QacA subfamily drug resistance transporter